MGTRSVVRCVLVVWLVNKISGRSRLTTSKKGASSGVALSRNEDTSRTARMRGRRRRKIREEAVKWYVRSNVGVEVLRLAVSKQHMQIAVTALGIVISVRCEDCTW